jgi:hypothetical protein
MPTLGEAFRAICEGVAHIKSMNGGVIPPDHDVKLIIETGDGENFARRSTVLNPKKLVMPNEISRGAFNGAMEDRRNREAIEAIHTGVHMHIIRTDEKTAKETLTGKNGESAMVFVELSPRK